MTTAMGDAIRSKIGKPKKKTDQEIGEKDLQGSRSRIGGRTLRTGCAAPGGDHGDRPPRGWRGAEAEAAARSRTVPL